MFVAFALSALCAAGADNKPAPAGLDGAWWVWAPTQDTPPEGTCYMRGGMALPDGAKVKFAEIDITADNLFALYVNGKFAGQGDSNPSAWNKPRRLDVTDMLQAGKNVLAVEAVNTAPGPAGVILKLSATLADGRQATFTTNPDWLSTDKQVQDWQLPGFDDTHWWQVNVQGAYGAAPWGKFAANLSSVPLQKAGSSPRIDFTQPVQVSGRQPNRKPGQKIVTVPKGPAETEPPAGFAWPEAIVFVGDDCSLYRGEPARSPSYGSLGVTMFTARKSRSFPEHDLPAPIKMGRKLYALAPARPGTKPRLLLDAGKGALGSPSVSFDGKSVYVSMAPEGDAFFHIYRIPAGGGQARRLTAGAFHDIDPVELPDGRLAFVSTRIGTFEEYHSPPSRSLFSMKPDGTDIRAITTTFVFDNEPEVLADGRIVFIRSDNFFGRGKVETLLHATFPDGTDGFTEFGLDNGPEYGNRLRAFYCGSPAPMPDGRVAFVSANGITVGEPGSPAEQQRQYRLPAGDVAAMPDGRLICTIARTGQVQYEQGGKARARSELNYDKIDVLDPRTNELTALYDSPGVPLHSPVFLGARPRPPVLAHKVDSAAEDDVAATGRLLCQNARFTRNTTAGWQHVRAIRVLGSRGLNTRSSHAYIVHAGSEVVELGTVPLAPDGSFFVEVPADMGIAFQAVDAEGRSELNEMSWIFVRPGETRSCVGCHHARQAVPPAGAAVPRAVLAEPLRALGQGEPHRFRGNNAAVTGLMEMQADRFREAASLNLHSLTPDPLAAGPQEVAALADALKTADAGTRISAAQRLGLFRDQAAAPALAAALKDRDRELRVAAALALAGCGTRLSVEPLLDALTDSDPLAAQAAAIALENLTGHAQAGYNAFAPSAERAVRAREWRAWFVATNWDAIEQQLVTNLESRNRDAARRAAVTLGHVGASSARQALRAYVSAERLNNPFPEWRKRYRGDGARFNSLSEANPRTLQAATRALGYLKDAESTAMLAETIARNSDSAAGNLFLAEAAAEALGLIGTPEAQDALVQGMKGLRDYFYYTGWYGDHSALYACHSCPVHYFITAALDATASTRAGEIVPNLIRSVPTDPDRALVPYSDDCETLVGRVIRRSGAAPAVTETCLSILGDEQAKPVKEIADAISTTYKAWAGKPDPENRAAHILSLACRDRAYEPRIRAALDRYRDKPVPADLVRAFGGGGLPKATPVKHWVCFYLARELGNLGDPGLAGPAQDQAVRNATVDSLVAVLEKCPPEAAAGRPPADDPAVLFLHDDLTPCYRAAAAWALGRIADKRAAPVLLKVIGDPDNAPDTRHAAAEALGQIADHQSLAAMRRLAGDCPDFATRRALLQACARMTR
jgi:HEAT repeat protein